MRIDLLDDQAHANNAVDPIDDLVVEPVSQRHQRYIIELELRLLCLRAERETLYAERHARPINDESLRNLVRELDPSKVSPRKRLAAAREAAGLRTA